MYELDYRYDDDNFSIRKRFPSGNGEIYDIPREMSTTPQEIAEWIFRIENKSWMNKIEFQSFRDKYSANCLLWIFGEASAEKLLTDSDNIVWDFNLKICECLRKLRKGE